MIYKLCMQYSASRETVQENYTLVLTNLYRGVETYNPNMEIKTWIHICTKRHVFEQEKRRYRQASLKDYDSDISNVENVLDEDSPTSGVMDQHNYRQYYNDDILAALDKLNPIHRDALILQQAGYSVAEIAEIEYQKGRLSSRNIDTVKSRLFIARETLKKVLNRNGTRKTNKAN